MAKTGNTGMVRADVLRAALALPMAGGAAILAACGAADQAASPGTSAGPVEIEYWSTLQLTHPEGKGRVEAMKISEQANAASVKVRYEQEGGSNWEKITAALTAGTPPNLLVFRPNNAAALADAGGGIDLEAVLKTLPAWNRIKANLQPGYLEGATWRGKQVALPLYTVNQALIYAPDHLDKAGVPAPRPDWAWADFETIAKRAARPPDVWGLDVLWRVSGWRLFAGSNGALFFNKQLTKVSYTQAESLAAVEFMAKLTHGLNLVPPEPLGELMAKGQTVFEPQGPYRMPVLREAGARFEPILMPRGPQKPTPYNWASMYSLIVFKAADPAKHRAAAQVALGCLADDAQAAMCKVHLGLPVTRAAHQSAAYQQYLAQDRQMKVFADMMSAVEVMPAVPSLERIWAIQDEAMNKVYKRQDTVRNAVQEAERQSQLLLDADLAAKK
jgi:ABC-type glycerol-3-phosphate transport system substrate-binding protein